MTLPDDDWVPKNKHTWLSRRNQPNAAYWGLFHCGVNVREDGSPYFQPYDRCSAQELLLQPGIGQATVEKIRRWLERHGRSLPDTLPRLKASDEDLAHDLKLIGQKRPPSERWSDDADRLLERPPMRRLKHLRRDYQRWHAERAYEWAIQNRKIADHLAEHGRIPIMPVRVFDDET